MTAIPTPPTRGGQTNRWRTFLRNLDWVCIARQLDLIEAQVSDEQLERTGFSSHAGSERATALWAETLSAPANAGA